MRNYYIQIHDYLEKLVYSIMEIDRKGISFHGENLSINDIYILKTLGNCQEKRLYEIIQELKINRNILDPLVKRLYTSHYIVKKRDPQDKRVQILSLTDKGLDALKEITEKEKTTLYNLLNDFTFNEEKAILKFLVKLDMLYKKSDS
ncbi:MarR family winged helix-turn-helix transcriptional regulator [Alkaliphilus serpentinus]|uniref:Winged helix DNA-binding protein n=1 Tax=Alkaliphilus serpentinus TaxID=1482731 RepID=A0A833HQJ8_9FIRM|nr:winged helix DNA-binding protein [Alkaliphilus serpentinus]KAB3532079.1 winged helix DNA-binding protein [Alkaliphilus serpentinus]